MRYAVFVYSIPIEEVGTVEQEGIDAGLFEAVDPANQLAELIAHEGVQREPVVMDEVGVAMLEQALKSWGANQTAPYRDTYEAYKEDN